MRANARYVWRGEKPRTDVRRLLARAQALVLSSLNEGGANVISEAIAAGIPVLASRIDGSVGLLGRDYPGYFAVGDTAALARLLRRIEAEPAFLARLRDAVTRRARYFAPLRETQAWRGLLNELSQSAGAARGRTLRKLKAARPGSRLQGRGRAS
jgi:glycosyltransferase involved in cell wall biosynthesis